MYNRNFEITQKNPILQFKEWFEIAKKSVTGDCSVMSLATCSRQGKPSVRIVLLKEIDNDGIVFFTNYQSKKGLQLAENPYSAITVYWPELQRQVRFEGITLKTSPEKSDIYFDERPLLSQIGAMVSMQSRELKDRARFDEAINETKKIFANKSVPRPKEWGGFKLVPDLVEFWQAQEYRLHDRIEFYKENDKWKTRFLFP